MKATECGCVITTRGGFKTVCRQPRAAGKKACYLHDKYLSGLTTPARSADVSNAIDGGGTYATTDDIDSIKDTTGQVVYF